MRGLLLLMVLGVLPFAAAQAPVELVTVEVAPFDEPVKPLQGTQTTEATVRVSCALAEPPASIVVTYNVPEAPAWATVLVSPSSDTAGPERCQTGYVTFIATLTVQANDQAPADVPAPIVLEARAGSGGAEHVERGEVNLTATWFSILDVQVVEAVAVVAPGATHAFPLKIANFGNGDTDVTITETERGEGITVRVPDTFRLGSKQQGSNDVSREVSIEVAADDARGFVNRVAVASLLVTSAYAADASQVGDDATVSLLVTVRSGAFETAANIPAPGPLLALLSAAALLRAFRP